MSENLEKGPRKAAYLYKIEQLDSKKIDKDECLFIPDYSLMPVAQIVGEEIQCN